MGLVQWIIIIVLIAIIIFGFAAVIDFSKGVIRNVYPHAIGGDAGWVIGNVTRVIDGDTIVIDNVTKIRFAVVNTPEKWEPGYLEAKEWTQYRCGNQMAFVDIDDGQKAFTYDRMIGAVYCGPDYQYYVNKELLELGLGNSSTFSTPCIVSEFREELCHIDTFTN
jgi:endonuclease YncB( thermonuclease family)